MIPFKPSRELIGTTLGGIGGAIIGLVQGNIKSAKIVPIRQKATSESV
jgi:hypothetical protein